MLQGGRRITTTRQGMWIRLGSGRCKPRSPLAGSQSILISAYWRFKCLCDDSLRLQAEGFWNDTGVSSHTVVRFMPMSEQSSKQLMHHMARCENGNVFTQGTLPWNPPKH